MKWEEAIAENEVRDSLLRLLEVTPALPLHSDQGGEK